MNHVILFTEQYSLLLSAISVVIAGVILFSFNKHTKKTERTEMQHLYVEQLRNITHEVDRILTKIQDENILKILSLLREDYNKVSYEDIRRIRILITESDYSIQSITNPIFTAQEYFDKNGIDNKKLEPMSIMGVQKNILENFIISTSKLISKNSELTLKNEDMEKEVTSIIAISEPYIESEANSKFIKSDDSSVDTPKIETKMVLMVAMRGGLTKDSWSNQSLGDWLISEKKTDKIRYILGVNVETRNIVSLTKVGNPTLVNRDDTSKYRFERDTSEEVYEQDKGQSEKLIKLAEATDWNTRNPIRYINLTVGKLKSIEDSLRN